MDQDRLFDAAIRGDLTLVSDIIKKDDLILDKIMLGLLSFKGTSPLHVAASKGHIDVVRELMKERPQMCLALDKDGHNALHVAAVNGEDDVLKELVMERPHAARVRVGCGGTILHLCVTHNRLSTLKMLMNMIKDEDFVSSKDHGGNTILHLAVFGKQLEIVEHVLKVKKFKIDAKNTNGRTAMDIVLFQAKTETNYQNSVVKDIEDRLREVHAKKAKDLLHGAWLSKKRDSLMVVASLIATMAFQAAVSPPGGVWQDNSDGHRAGEAVMAENYANWYPYFLRSNTIGFVASLSTILLLISGVPSWKRVFTWIVLAIMWLAITSMAFTYAFSIVVVTPIWARKSLSRTIVIAVIVWCAVLVVILLVHVVNVLFNAFKELRSRRKAVARIEATQGRRHNP